MTGHAVQRAETPQTVPTCAKRRTLSDMSADTTLTREQTASLLGIHPATLDRWRKAGYGPPWRRIGHRYHYPADRVDQWIESRMGDAEPVTYRGA